MNQIQLNKKIMNEPVYLGLSILEIIKIVMHEFWFHFVEPKYDEKAKLCYIDTDSLIVYIKTNGIYERHCPRF